MLTGEHCTSRETLGHYSAEHGCFKSLSSCLAASTECDQHRITISVLVMACPLSLKEASFLEIIGKDTD